MPWQTPMTRHTALVDFGELGRSLAELRRATVDQRTMPLVEDALRHYAKAAPQVMVHELNQIDRHYKSSCQEALLGALTSIAYDRGWESAKDGREPYANNDDLRRVLAEPMPPAVVLSYVAKYLEVEPPAVMRTAVQE